MMKKKTHVPVVFVLRGAAALFFAFLASGCFVVAQESGIRYRRPVRRRELGSEKKKKSAELGSGKKKKSNKKQPDSSLDTLLVPDATHNFLFHIANRKGQFTTYNAASEEEEELKLNLETIIESFGQSYGFAVRHVMLFLEPEQLEDLTGEQVSALVVAFNEDNLMLGGYEALDFEIQKTFGLIEDEELLDLDFLDDNGEGDDDRTKSMLVIRRDSEDGKLEEFYFREDKNTPLYEVLNHIMQWYGNVNEEDLETNDDLDMLQPRSDPSPWTAIWTMQNPAKFEWGDTYSNLDDGISMSRLRDDSDVDEFGREMRGKELGESEFSANVFFLGTNMNSEKDFYQVDIKVISTITQPLDHFHFFKVYCGFWTDKIQIHFELADEDGDASIQGFMPTGTVGTSSQGFTIGGSLSAGGVGLNAAVSQTYGQPDVTITNKDFPVERIINWQSQPRGCVKGFLSWTEPTNVATGTLVFNPKIIVEVPKGKALQFRLYSWILPEFDISAQDIYFLLRSPVQVGNHGVGCNPNECAVTKYTRDCTPPPIENFLDFKTCT